MILNGFTSINPNNISSIIITGLDSTDTVTCVWNLKSYVFTWDETTQCWIASNLPLGEFIVTATNGTKTFSKTVLIDNAGIYKIEIRFYIHLVKDGIVVNNFNFLLIQDNFDSRTSTVLSYNPLKFGRIGARWARLYTNISTYISTYKYNKAHIIFYETYADAKERSSFHIEDSTDASNWSELVKRDIYYIDNELEISLSNSPSYIAIKISTGTVSNTSNVTIKDFWLE